MKCCLDIYNDTNNSPETLTEHLPNAFELFCFSTKKKLHDLLEAKDIAAAVKLLRAANDTWPAEELFNFKVPV